MPYRKVIITEGEIYHIFNRSVEKIPIFCSQKDYQRALHILHYYSFQSPPLRFSHFNRLTPENREAAIQKLTANDQKLVEILAYCLMPNHFHLLIKEVVPNGISTFLRNFQNSYAKYFNIKNQRNGALFLAMFKAARIESTEQLLHVLRYIHLNPLTSYLIKGFEDLDDYLWSSWKTYMRTEEGVDLVNRTITEELLPTKEKFRQFHENQIDYQRTLSAIKHLIHE